MIELVIDARRKDLGGFEVGRVLLWTERRMVGPFTFFDHMGPVDMPPDVPRSTDVRPHPHIGLSTITYLFFGEIVHRDGVGVHQVIRPGEVNWMTAGRGISHSEAGVPIANPGEMAFSHTLAVAVLDSIPRMHKESHQVLDLSALFAHFTKFSAKVLEPEIVPEVVRKAFKVAQAEKPGASFIELPENIARMPAGDRVPLKVQAPVIPRAPQEKVEQVAGLIDEASVPLVLVGNGVIRQRASEAVVAFIERLKLPAMTTFMAKGAVPSSHPSCVGTIGLPARDPAAFGLEQADLVLCVGYDMVEYDPARWNPKADKRIVHIDSAPAEVDAHYVLAAGIVGDIAHAVERIGDRAASRTQRAYRANLSREGAEAADSPLKPQRVIADLRRAMAAEDVLVSDVGAHKLWIARLFEAERPNT